ncbi:hypothetical protein BKI52_05595 [marine bacterium AO1-C]|nr:hypothetical protein BKI52_05595 [marine bacterium AO1-C]
MFFNLIIFLGILVIATVAILANMPGKRTLPKPIYYQNQSLDKECQVSASFAREAKAAPLNPNEQEEVESLYTTLK